MKPVQIEDLLSYRFLSFPLISPTGRDAVFTVRIADPQADGYETNLWRLRLNDGTATPLTNSGKDGAFVWDADGTGIFFLSERATQETPDGNAVYHIRVDGGEARRVACLPYKAESLALCSDGSLLHTARIPLSKEAKHEDDADYEVLDEIPFWMNGKGFTNRRRLHLFRLDPESGDVLDLCRDDPSMEVESYDVRGARAALIARRFDGVAPTTRELWLFDLEGQERRLLAKGLAMEEVRFLDDDSLVFLASDMSAYGLNENREVMCLDIASGSMESLTPKWDRSTGNSIAADCRHGGGPTLRVDNGRILVSITDRSVGVLMAVTPSGTVDEVVRSTGSIDAFDVRGDTVIAVELLPERLQEATLYRSGCPTSTTALNEDALRDRELRLPEPFTVRSPEGDEIDAWLIRPRGVDPQVLCPTILTIHGGPRAAYSAVFFHQMQAMAGRGYAVVICNPHGSSGRGNAFADLRTQYGKIDYDDLMAVVDEALARFPFLDASRLGVMGGSYGGFMTNWIIGQTHRFRAAVSQRSIANWISKFNTTDIGYYFNKDQIGTDPWAESGAETLWWHSPLRSANHAKTPTLFIHSDEDYRCWLSEGLQMFTALRYHGVDSRLVLFHGENHELSRSGKPKHRLRRLHEILAWFDEHLCRGKETC